LFGNGTASYQGYVPTFEGDLNDYNATLGYNQPKWMEYRCKFNNLGGNTQIYTVSNSKNRSFNSNGIDFKDRRKLYME
jgi:iron complex outermembrane receptor protein